LSLWKPEITHVLYHTFLCIIHQDNLCRLLFFFFCKCLLIFNCNWVDTRWQQCSTQLHTISIAVQYTVTHKQYSSTVHSYTQTVHRIQRTEYT
jgi:hypothetical protein